MTVSNRYKGTEVDVNMLDEKTQKTKAADCCEQGQGRGEDWKLFSQCDQKSWASCVREDGDGPQHLESRLNMARGKQATKIELIDHWLDLDSLLKVEAKGSPSGLGRNGKRKEWRLSLQSGADTTR